MAKATTKKPVVYGQDDELDAAWARILILSAPKAGKTTIIATTSPGPILILNGDRRGALAPAQRAGASFSAIDVTTAAELTSAVTYALELAAQGAINTCVVDTISLLQESIITEAKGMSFTAPNGSPDTFAMWGWVLDTMTREIGRLLDIDAHLIFAGHAIEGSGDLGDFGTMPLLQGKFQKLFAAKVQDIIWLQVSPDGERKFLLGPQGRWTGGGRHIKAVGTCAPDIRVLLAELGIQP